MPFCFLLGCRAVARSVFLCRASGKQHRPRCVGDAPPTAYDGRSNGSILFGLERPISLRVFGRTHRGRYIWSALIVTSTTIPRRRKKIGRCGTATYRNRRSTSSANVSLELAVGRAVPRRSCDPCRSRQSLSNGLRQGRVIRQVGVARSLADWSSICERVRKGFRNARCSRRFINQTTIAGTQASRRSTDDPTRVRISRTKIGA